MLRTAILAAPRRLFSTAAVARAPGGNAFTNLVNISSDSPETAAESSTATANVVQSSTPFAAPSIAVDPSSSRRGFSPDALPARNDPVLELFTNALMRSGKKAEAQKHVSNILTLLQRATNKPPVPLLHEAIALSAPSVKVFHMRHRAKTTVAPRPLTERARTTTGVRWLLKASERGRKSGIRRDDRIAREILAVLEGSSDVFKRVEEVHKIGMLNRYVVAAATVREQHEHKLTIPPTPVPTSSSAHKHSSYRGRHDICIDSHGHG